MAKLYHLDHVRISPDRQIDAHRQPTWELSHIICGRGMRTIEGQCEPFRAGEVVLVCPGQTHQWTFSADSGDADGLIENVSLTFSTPLLDRLIAVLPETAEQTSRLQQLDHAIRLAPEAAAAVARKLAELEKEAEPLALLTVFQILLLLSEATGSANVGTTRTKTEAETRLEQITAFLSCNFQRAISLDDVARHAGMNRSSLCSFYKRQTGRTLFSALTALRIRSAKYLLRSTALPVTTIAYRSGFNDVPYFNRTFKRIAGMSPLQWRASGPVAQDHQAEEIIHQGETA